ALAGPRGTDKRLADSQRLTRAERDARYAARNVPFEEREAAEAAAADAADAVASHDTDTGDQVQLLGDRNASG
ncbi:MAG: hypothetical protein QOJ32_636, partial [Frankiaceae bacterium]|nr:hypothetical protein [Frankiaceae bacterium]